MKQFSPPQTPGAVAVTSQELRPTSQDLRSPLARAPQQESRPNAQEGSARALHLGAGILSLAVLADSGVEHYRGSFQNRAMITPLVSASLALVAASTNSLKPRALRKPTKIAYRLAEATGFIGSCFHVYNILKRPGGLSWLNLFYAAPIGAPAALTLAGFFGDCALKIQGQDKAPAVLFGQPAGRLLAAAASLGLVGTVGEAGLLHFRGAYHDPAMFLPVSLPPVAAGLLAATAAAPERVPRKPVRAWLGLTAALGVVGVGFHTFGVWRNMGGWKNWSQNVLNGPPLPAPPSFTGLAIIGLAALALMGAADE